MLCDHCCRVCALAIWPLDGRGHRTFRRRGECIDSHRVQGFCGEASWRGLMLVQPSWGGQCRAFVHEDYLRKQARGKQ